LSRAVEAAGDALYRDESGIERLAGGSPPADTLRAAAQRRADALGLLAERAMEAGFGAESGEGTAPISGTRAARYQVVLHVDAATLSEDSAGPAADAGGSGRSELEDGTHVSCAMQSFA
jgi:hypothetical protein